MKNWCLEELNKVFNVEWSPIDRAEVRIQVYCAPVFLTSCSVTWPRYTASLMPVVSLPCYEPDKYHLDKPYPPTPNSSSSKIVYLFHSLNVELCPFLLTGRPISLKQGWVDNTGYHSAQTWVGVKEARPWQHEHSLLQWNGWVCPGPCCVGQNCGRQGTLIK